MNGVVVLPECHVLFSGSVQREARIARIAYIEPYYGGSHRKMVDLLKCEFGGDLYTLPSTKWNWRMRISALHFSDTIPRDKEYT